MAKQNINVGTAANDKKGDSLRAAFVKVNANFTELYTALGIAADADLNLGNFVFESNTVRLTNANNDDSTATQIEIAQPVRIESNLTVGGDVVPNTANGGDLGSSTLPWRSLYVSNNTIYIGGTAVGVDANGALTTGGTVVGSTPAWANITGKPTFATVATTGAYADLTGRPTSFNSLVTGAYSVNLESGGVLRANVQGIVSDNQLAIEGSTLISIQTLYGPFLQLFNQGATKEINLVAWDGESLNYPTWSFDTDRTLTLPNDSSIKSATNIDITVDTPDSSTFNWRFGADGALTFPDGTSQSTAGGGSSIPAVVTTGAAGVNGAAHAKVQFTVASATTVTAVGVTAIGVTDSTKGTITLSGSPGTGAFDIVAVTNTYPGEFYIFIPFATNASGTGYGAPISGEGTNPCLVRGTLITMADMSRVAVENITYGDDILVWDFDLGEFASAKPLWIKKTQTTVVSCLLTFSDHSELRIVGDSPKAHRIFNKEAGKFTYGSMPETPIGTTTFNDQGEEITLISKEWIVGEVEFYNVMTDYHMNLFANSILTSMRYNNLYSITDMKFVKDSRTLRTADDYPNVEERLYKGFRLAEQTQSVEEIETHIQWLMTLEVERETECV